MCCIAECVDAMRTENESWAAFSKKIFENKAYEAAASGRVSDIKTTLLDP